MTEQVNKVRVIIRHASSSLEEVRLIPSDVFKKFYNRVHNAIKSACVGKPDQELFIEDLKIGSAEFELSERSFSSNAGHSGVPLFWECAQGIYQNDYRIGIRNPNIGKKIVQIAKAYDGKFDAAIILNDGCQSIPIDAFFRKQAEKFNNTLIESQKTTYFAGSAIDTYTGFLRKLDYLKPVWTSTLELTGGKQIECTFDNRIGEDYYNQFGNKRVSITGKAFYTGESMLPARISVLKIRIINKPEKSIDFRGSLSIIKSNDWDTEIANI